MDHRWWMDRPLEGGVTGSRHGGTHMGFAGDELIAADQLDRMSPALQLLHPSLQALGRLRLVNPMDTAIPVQFHLQAQLLGEPSIDLDAAVREVVIGSGRA